MINIDCVRINMVTLKSQTSRNDEAGMRKPRPSEVT